MPDHETSATTADSRLIRALGVWGLAASIVNVTIGGGIYRAPAAAAATLGPAAPIAYVVCAVAMALIVLCFADAGSRVSLTGGVYAYVEVAFGPFIGFVTGVMLWAGMTAALAAVASFFSDSLGALVPALAPPAARGTVLVVVLAALAYVNVLGVRGASRFNAALTAAKLLPLLLLVGVGVLAMKTSHLAWDRVPAPGEVSRASAFLIFIFLGVEAALVPSGEVRDPARTVPRAIFLAMTAITIVYVSVHLVTQGILGPALAAQKTPVAEAAGRVMGATGLTAVLLGSTVSMFAYLSGMTLAVPRILFAFGRDGFLPRALADVHARHHTPHRAIVAQTAIVAALAVSGGFEKLALVANGTTLLAYAACCIAAWQLRRAGVRAGDGSVPFRVPAASVVPWLALAVIAWMLSGLSGAEWAAMGIVALAAVVLYAATMKTRQAAVA